MKVASLTHPVMSDWFEGQGLRLDASLYVSDALEGKKALERLKDTVPLASLTAGFDGGIFKGPISQREYLTDPEHSVPFLGTRDMMAADLTRLQRLRKSTALPYLQLKPGMTLISRSGFNAGRRAYTRPDMGNCWASEDVLRVEPDPKKIKSGYLYAFLLSRFGESLVRGAVYGSAVKHIEPHHIAGLPVPRFDAGLEGRVHLLIQQSARLRACHQSALEAATKDFFDSNGLPELNEIGWHRQQRDLGFEVEGVGPVSLRALNFAPRARKVFEKLGLVDHETLGAICAGGQLSRGVRFTRVESDTEHGVQLVGQRQAFWLRPEGRWIAASKTPSEVFASDETILIAARGTLGESEVYCRPVLATGSFLKYAYSEDFLRILSGTPDIPGAYLFAFFRSEAAFRLLRSLSVGGKQQDIHEGLRAAIPIPLAPPADRTRIANTVRYAYKCRDRADVLEDKALALLTTAIEEAAG